MRNTTKSVKVATKPVTKPDKPDTVAAATVTPTPIMKTTLYPALILSNGREYSMSADEYGAHSFYIASALIAAGVPLHKVDQGLSGSKLCVQHASHQQGTLYLTGVPFVAAPCVEVQGFPGHVVTLRPGDKAGSQSKVGYEGHKGLTTLTPLAKSVARSILVLGARHTGRADLALAIRKLDEMK